MVIEDALQAARARRQLPAPGTRRLIREQAGVTQEDVATAVNVSRAAVSRWESGDREPRRGVLGAYVSLLDRLKREVLS